MSQFDWGVIDPNSKSGPQLALDLNDFRDALNTLHRGAVRPSYAQPGMQWVREVSAERWELCLYDGQADLVLRSFNPVTSQLFKFSRSDVDGLDEELAKMVLKDASTTTGAALIPAGATAQRPSSPVGGMIRLNTDLGEFERYQGGKWLAMNLMDKAFGEAPIVTLASSTTLNVGAAASNTISVSGTTTITAFDSVASGAVRRLVFQADLIVTHGPSLILPGGASIKAKAGDIAEFVSQGSGVWRCLSYQPSVPARHGPKLAVSFNGQATPPTIYAQEGSVKVTSITRVATGVFDINLDAPITTVMNALFSPGMRMRISGGVYTGLFDLSTSTSTKLRVTTADSSGLDTNVAPTSFVFYGPES